MVIVSWCSSPFWSSKLPDILGYVPAEFDQIVYIDVNSDLADYVSKTNTNPDIDATVLADLHTKIKSIVMYQWYDGTTPHGLVIMHSLVDDADTIAKQLGLLPDDPTYIAKVLADNITAYGDQAALDFLDIARGTALTTKTEITDFFAALDDHQVAFISTPGDQSWSNPMIAQFADQLSYTLVKTRLGDKLSGTVRLLFGKDILPTKDISFTPTMIAQAPADSSVAIEMSGLLSLFALEKSQFTMLATLGLGQANPNISAAMTTADYERMYDMLDGQMMLSVSPSPSLFGMSAQLMTSVGWLFDMMTKISPAISELAGGIFGSGNIVSTITSDEITFTVNSLFPEVWTGENWTGDALQVAMTEYPVLQITPKGDGDLLRVFPTDATGTLDISFGTLDPNTIAVLYSQWPEVTAALGLPMVDTSSEEMVAIKGMLSIIDARQLQLRFEQE